MKLLDHPNIIRVKHFFTTNDEKKGDEHLNIVMDYIPSNLYRIMKDHEK
jgi:glycogen synthase kinase 3 beta